MGACHFTGISQPVNKPTESIPLYVVFHVFVFELIFYKIDDGTTGHKRSLQKQLFLYPALENAILSQKIAKRKILPRIAKRKVHEYKTKEQCHKVC